ncbi:MAG: hypothetical protein QG597_2859 [Actinomycetota bacterium]|nr:hypothetical protein [Actinomycetota bacterium]
MRPPAIDDAELVLRRYDPADPHHCVVDQMTGRARVTAAAFTFKEAQPAEREFGHLLASCNRDVVLASMGVSRQSVIRPPHWRLAGAVVRDICAVVMITDSEPCFEVFANPLRQGCADQTAEEASHALISLVRSELSRNKQRRLVSDMARRFTPMM